MTESSPSKARRTDIPAYQQQSYTVRDVLPTIIGSNVILALVTFVYWKYHESLGIQNPQHHSTLDRLVLAVKLSYFSLLPLLLSAFHVMMGRATHPKARNPLSGNEHVVEKSNRILTNTVEQTPLHVINVAVFALVVPSEHLFMVGFLVFCFVLGRVTFLVGYVVHPKHRVFGFVFTFVPTCLLCAYNGWKLVIDGGLWA